MRNKFIKQRRHGNRVSLPLAFLEIDRTRQYKTRQQQSVVRETSERFGLTRQSSGLFGQTRNRSGELTLNQLTVRRQSDCLLAVKTQSPLFRSL